MSERIFSRRALMEAASASAALVLVESGVEAQTPAASEPQRVSKDMVQQALATVGLQFSDADLKMMLGDVNDSLKRYESLRKVQVPLDTDPAFRFSPMLPGDEIASGPPRFTPSKSGRVQRPGSIKELAFAPVTKLSALVRARQVTSTELTKMYLERLKRFSPKLNCVITLTEDLALEQAARADREIRSGKYRGPLHGIPYGAKDLFATRSIPTTWGAGPFEKQVFDYDATVITRL